MRSILLSSLVFLFASSSVFSQGIMGGLKKKAAELGERALEKKVDEKIEEKTGVDMGNNAPGTSTPSQGNSGNGSPSNQSGGGLVVTPPDVKQNITDAESAFKSANYSEARYAVQQAMLGVEMEIGNEVLESLPSTVSGLPKEADADQVTSSGWGWVGLTIHREYRSGDKELQITVANNSAWMSAVNVYLSNPGYAQSSQQNWKQVKVQDNRGIIEFDQSSGYKVSVPIGQSSLIVWQGINFQSEQDMMSAVNAFSVSTIKSKLGEK